jgi:iron(III) transport system permease protein
MAKVRTFAEEVYTQFASPDPLSPDTDRGNGLPRAVAVAVPPALLIGLLAAFAVWRWERRLPPLTATIQPFVLIRLGKWRWPVFSLMALLFVIVIGIPIFSLIRQTGLSAFGEQWSSNVARQSLERAIHSQRGLILRSLSWAALTGMGVSCLALLGCWLARDRRWLRGALLVLLILAWTMPGPVIGIGLKEAINRLMDLEELVSGGHVTIIQSLFYNGPSPLPVMWATAVRFFPIAIALLWPAVRAVPRELVEAARVDGASPIRELRLAIIPAIVPAFLRAVLAVTALSLGELSASKLVETPGRLTLAQWIFNQMHYGVERNLAAMCLVLLGVIMLVLVAGEVGVRSIGRRFHSEA